VNMPQTRMLLSAVVGAMLLAAPSAGFGESQPTDKVSPSELVKSVIYNELHPANTAEVHWKYQLTKEANGKQETRAVVETKSGSLDRLLSVAGKPLTGTQESDEEGRILKFSHSPEEQRKAEQSRRKDAEQCNTILKMIPDAFLFEYAGESGHAAKLTFKANPRFVPPSREGKVLQQMAGEMWVDARQKRLISINGRLVNDVKFGGGFLGHLEKGGEFSVKRAEIAPGDWEMTELTVDMQGKALLFKSICVQQKETHSNFEQMPDALSLADAADLLLRQTVVAFKQ
jgi:hypothetical protein